MTAPLSIQTGILFYALGDLTVTALTARAFWQDLNDRQLALIQLHVAETIVPLHLFQNAISTLTHTPVSLAGLTHVHELRSALLASGAMLSPHGLLDLFPTPDRALVRAHFHLVTR